ncbi:hypothetical protein MGYG_01255 [Nannizzia gypsea CBS 118893]|uniref:F-box domain-containing protein n=1 Tax=Arthroderma gypseum (strain ATCC MYA-4604 / CBS 118893) TaxID=535722 RepID=E5QZR9_ARTGP|nr:hypothetical protein MGYG_01255 [Nannizzia gypsea CBS 118893]EFQ98220.1 hypothetical protein MGYG_01255 [Nannizzia gypsea CBS 118893]
MSIVATATPGSQRMSSNTASYQQFTPPHNPAVLPQSPRSPIRSPTFPLLYSNHTANSSVPSLYSPATVRYSYYPPTKHGRISPQDQQPMPVFTNRLPDEVYECILTHLWSLHISSCTEGCLTCYMRDLYSLSLTDRAWEKAVRGRLYNKIYLHGSDSPGPLKKYKWKRGSRLRLLRRTLRERKALANMVFELRVPELDAPLMTGKQHVILQEYRDLVASVVMVCPNLERLLGLSIPYNHEFDRLTHALSTRKKLKEHAWIIGPNAEATERSQNKATEVLDQGQVYQFLSHHTSWSKLESMVLHSMDSKGILEHGVFIRMFNFLPALQNLSVSGFEADNFTDRTLLFLPALTSLRLEGLQGVTENGLARYVGRPEARGLKSLALVEQNISSLLILSKILASLGCLERFTIVQSSVVPSLPKGGMVFQPLLASATLKHLHWDVACPNGADALNQIDTVPFSKVLSTANTPNSHLAQSILHVGFPSLERLRAPLDIDPLGALQNVCRPSKNGLIMVPADRHNLPRSSHGSLPKRPLAMPAGNNLSSARIRSQALIDIAAKENDEGVKVIITDHSEDFLAPNVVIQPGYVSAEAVLALNGGKAQTPALKILEFLIPACMGRVGLSNKSSTTALTPRFTLQPDIPNSDADGGIISHKHLFAANQTSLFTSCSPSPNHPPIPVASHNSKRTNTNSSFSDDTSSPSTATTTTSSSSRFSVWGGSNTRINHSNSKSTSSNPPMPPKTPTSPTRGTAWPTTGGNGDQPFWAKDTCNGSWNQGHKYGKEWWSHAERERNIGGIKKSNTSAALLSVSDIFR